MKKIMLALCAAVIATAVNAASVSWAYNATGKTWDGYTVYLTTTAGTFDSVDAIKEKLLSTSNASGALIAGSRNSLASGTITGLAETTSYDFFFTVVNEATGDYWVSTAQKVTTNAESAGAATASFSAANGASLLKGTPTGKFSSVPEPTSGLLLLLGMAGLALKRKVA